MVMKDKIVKTNHKKGYYTMKKVSFGSLIMATAFFACFIPTYISLNTSVNEQVKAENIQEPEVTEQTQVLLNY